MHRKSQMNYTQQMNCQMFEQTIVYIFNIYMNNLKMTLQYNSTNSESLKMIE